MPCRIFRIWNVAVRPHSSMDRVVSSTLGFSQRPCHAFNFSDTLQSNMFSLGMLRLWLVTQLPDICPRGRDRKSNEMLLMCLRMLWMFVNKVSVFAIWTCAECFHTGWKRGCKQSQQHVRILLCAVRAVGAVLACDHAFKLDSLRAQAMQGRLLQP